MSTPRSIAAVPGLSRTSPQFRAALWELADRNGWDVDAIAAVMSIESGFKPAAKNPLEGQTATGLIQFTDSTARSLGVKGGAAELRTMSDLEQLPLVEAFYARAFGGLVGRPRVVDYYLAGWGRGIGQPDGFVLADSVDPLTFNGGKDNAYTLNRGLDLSGDGQITVGDLVKIMGGRIAAAKGERLSAAPVLFASSATGGGADWFPVAALAGVALWFGRKEWMKCLRSTFKK